MTQFKETEAFADLQKIVGNEIAATFLGRLNEFGVPNDRLQQLAEDICYDIAAAMNKVRDFEIPEPEPVVKIVKVPEPTPVQEQKAPPAQQQKTNDAVMPDQANNRPALAEEKTDDFELPDLSANDDFFLEKTDEYDVIESVEEMDDQPVRPAAGVLSPDEILKIMNAAKTAP